MQSKITVLAAVAGLLAMALAGPPNLEAVPNGLDGGALRRGNGRVGRLLAGEPPQRAAPRFGGRSVPGSGLKRPPDAPRFLNPPLGSPPSWLPEARITGSNRNRDVSGNNSHKIVVADNGVRHVVMTGDDGHVYYKRYYPQWHCWTPDTLIFGDSCPSGAPGIALDSNGTTVHVCAVVNSGANGQPTHIYYKRCTTEVNPEPGSNGGWDTTCDVCEHRDPDYSAAGPSIACGPNHRVVICWLDWDGEWGEVCFREILNGVWQTSLGLSDATGSPSIACARNGDVHVAWSKQWWHSILGACRRTRIP